MNDGEQLVPGKLTRGEAHIWVTDPAAINAPNLLTRYMDLLGDDEREKHQRFHFERDRHRYLVAHALMRCTLSRYANLCPEQWSFTSNRFGRPEIAAWHDRPALQFNLSHTEGLVACAVSMDHEIGVDVESLERSGQTISIANQFFSPAESAELRATEPAEQRQRFFSYWTLKESYIKARGMGLSIPLRQFAFDLRDQNAIRIAFTPPLEDDPDSWTFKLFRPTARHVLAIGMRFPASKPLAIQLRTTVPLMD